MNTNVTGLRTKGILATAAVLIMVLCLFVAAVPADAADTGSDAETSTVEVSTSQELTTALSNQSVTTIVLTGDIQLSQKIEISRNLTLDLGGHTLSAASATVGGIIDLQEESNNATTGHTASTVTIRNGTISSVLNNENANGLAENEYSAIVVGNGDVLTIDGVTINSHGYGIYTADGSTVTISNTNIESWLATISANAGSINTTINVTINSGTFTSLYDGAVYMVEIGTLDINGGTFRGTNGIEVRAGTVTIDNATITATGSLTAANVNGDRLDGALDYGMALAVIDNSGYAGTNNISVTIGNGVTLNGSSYDVYVGDANLNTTSHAFDADTIGNQFTPVHTISVVMPGHTVSYTASTAAYRFAATDVTATSFTVPAGYVFAGDVSFNGTDKATIPQVKAGSDGITFSQGSVVISGTFTPVSGTSAANLVITSSGDITLDGLTLDQYPGITVTPVNKGTTDVVIDGLTNATTGGKVNVTISEGASVEIVAGTTLDGAVTNNGTLYLNGTVTGAVNSSASAGGTQPTVVIGENGSADKLTGTANYESSTAQGSQNTGLQGQMNFNMTLSTPEYLSADYTIAEGYTLTLQAGGSLNLNGHKLIVNGTLVIANGAAVTGIQTSEDQAGNQGIVLTAKGVIDNSGLIGKGASAVSVIAYSDGGSAADATNNVTQAGSVSLLNVMGISFSLDKTVANGKVTYQLAFSGNAVRNGTGDYTIVSNGALIDGDLTIGNSVTFIAADTTVDGVTVTINGIVGGELELLTGSVITLNGQTYGDLSITAHTGKYQTSIPAELDKLGYTKVTMENVRGITVSVASESYMDKKVNMTEQKMLVSGSASRATDIVETTNPSSNYKIVVENQANDSVNGTGIYVEGELYLPLAAGNGTTSNQIEFDLTVMMTVTGQVSADGPIVDGRATYITGTAYSVGTTNTVYYITGFDAAYAAISTANSQEITVYGKLDLSAEYTVSQGQIITLGAGAVVKIAENGAVTIENGGYINGTIDTVDGVLTVIYGGTTQPPTNYAVRTTNANNDVIYSGLAYALNNATEGQTVNLVKKADVKGSLTIPAGVTLDVNQGAILTVGKNLTVNGTLANHGNVSVGRNVSVAGTIDNTESQKFDVCTDTTDDYDVTVSGTGSITFVSGTVPGEKYNGSYYQNDDGETVFTTLSNAATSVAGYDIVPEITVIGTYSENATVNANGPVTIADKAVVSVTEIVLDDCQIDIVGTFTGAVTGQSGEDGSTVASTVQFSKATGVSVTNADAPNDANVTVWTTTVSVTSAIEGMFIFGVNLDGQDLTYDETMTVTAGVVTLDDMYILGQDEDNPAVTVNAGAELVVPMVNDTAVEVAVGGMVVEGTLTVEGDLTSRYIDVRGTLDVAVGGNVDVIEMIVTGTVNVAQTEEEAGTFAVDGIVTVGEKPETLGATATGAIVGKVGFGTYNDGTTTVNGGIRAYAGADMSQAVFAENEGVSTAYYINDVLYMTVYFKDTSVAPVISVVGEGEVYDMPAYQTDGIKYLKADGSELGTEVIGQVDAVYATVKASSIGGIVSVGNGLTMYIDGLTIENFRKPVNDFNYSMSVGTHTVSIAANSGYDASNAVITFNGQTVQNGGTITVTADMFDDGFTLAASGAVPATSGGSTTVVSGDDGMGLTDYLLIILVILIVVMAIMVAMRLMRS